MNKELLASLKEYKTLMGKEDAISEQRKGEILSWLSSYQGDDKKEVNALLDEWLTEMEADNEDIKQTALKEQMNSDIYKILPLRLISEKYFGKSAAWLSQRINGTKVRGKTYTLSDQQKATFNRAIKDIANQLGSFQLA